ncbi:MAG: hypothetical protein L0G72_08205, partial [Brevibacterium aurantiacum]|nr:hypothetical protein [Brevibacterium aurantiacum]
PVKISLYPLKIKKISARVCAEDPAGRSSSGDEDVDFGIVVFQLVVEPDSMKPPSGEGQDGARE